jgi:hypothetical protein
LHLPKALIKERRTGAITSVFFHQINHPGRCSLD